MIVLIAVLLPLVLGTTGALLVARFGQRAVALTVAAVTATSLAVLLAIGPQVIAGDPVAYRIPWVDAAGLALAFRIDGLALLFALLITAVGLLVILYAHYYLGRDEPGGRFHATLMLFMGAMLGVVTADNLLLLAAFWELTSLASFLLIAHHNRDPEARRSARLALAITGGGGLAMLAGFLVLGRIAGTFEIGTLLTMGTQIRADPLYPVALLLILAGAFTKSAQVPFHFWLPAAMAAPTPVSAYLHSATMVKAGIFLVARLYPALGNTELFSIVVSCAGLATLAFAAFVAMFQHDLKGLLAYSTVSHLGIVMFLLGLQSPLSAVAAVFHVLNHATFKASLFMAAGIIAHEAGSRDMRELAGLWRTMPRTASLAMVAAAAMAGVPLLNGFLSKEMFFAEALDAGELGAFSQFVPYVVMVGGACSVAYSIRFIHDVFFHGEPRGAAGPGHEPPRFMRLPIEILVGVCVVVGLLPSIVAGPIVHAAATAVHGAPLPDYTLAVWHGFNWPLAMSAAAIVAGVALYLFLQRIYTLHEHAGLTVSMRGGLEILLGSTLAGARHVVRLVSPHGLQGALAILVGVTIAMAAWPLVITPPGFGDQPALDANPVAVLVWAIMVTAAAACALQHRDRLFATILSGVVGLCTALTFVAFSAPDLALTQIAVEVASTVLLLMGLALLPRTSPADSAPRQRLGHALIATVAGVGLSVLAYAVLTRPHDSIAGWFLANSVPGGGGANVVNVILVDFRGFDTLGEITVLGIAALGVAALLDRLHVTRTVEPEGPLSGHRHPLMLTVVSRWLLPFALLVSAYIFFRGHNAPGGGFIAGLVTAAGLIMQYIGQGLATSEQRLPMPFDRAIGVGLTIAALTGLASMALGAPFLTSAHGHPVLPLLGEVPLASAMFFDLGVYVTVVASTMLTLAVLGHALAPRHDGEHA